ncbi:unnamed protein product, partial [Mesorhabditis spiculigera]
MENSSPEIAPGEVAVLVEEAEILAGPSILPSSAEPEISDDAKVAATTPVSEEASDEEAAKPARSLRAATGLGALLGNLRDAAKETPHEVELVVEEKEAEKTAPQKFHSARAASGLGTLLGNLRKAEPDNTEQPEVVREENVDGEPPRKLNRKERRALMQGAVIRSEEIPEVPDAVPTNTALNDHLVQYSTDPSTSGCKIEKIASPFRNGVGFPIGQGKTLPNCYLRRVAFSSCGNFLATDSQDNIVRIFGIQEGVEEQSSTPLASFQSGGFLVDLSWHPVQPYLAVAVRSCGVRIYSKDGTRVTSIRAKNYADELAEACCLSWLTPTELAIGYLDNSIRFYDVNNPLVESGRVLMKDNLTAPHQAKLSCLSSTRDGRMLAIGDFRGGVTLYERTMAMFVTTYQLNPDAVVDLQFAPDDLTLFVAHRKCDSIFAVNTRLMADNIKEFPRPYGRSPQRIRFDIDCSGSWLISGAVAEDGGKIYLFRIDDLNRPPIVLSLPVTSALSTISIHPTSPIVAVGSGERIFPNRPSSLGLSDSSDDEAPEKPRDRYLYYQSIESPSLENQLYLIKFV